MIRELVGKHSKESMANIVKIMDFALRCDINILQSYLMWNG